ncbi:MAG: hypothetical protein ACE10D_12955 [Planctomycetota bacterium]|nr:hypothetical protein [Planctomycetota bacterium]
MRALLLLLLPALVACRNQRNIDILEREMLRYRADNEDLRAEKLEERYVEQREKADRLALRVRAVSRERDALYVQYDTVRKQLSDQRKLQAEIATQTAAVQGAIKKEEEALEALQKELDKVRKDVEALRKKLQKAEAMGRALQDKKEGGESPPP